MSNYIDKFLMRSILGRKINPKEPESVIKGCISKAYDDMLNAGRFYKLGDKSSNCIKIHDLLKANGYRFSIQLIKSAKDIFGGEIIRNSKSYATSFGLSQKVINMTYKYFYCFHEFTGLDIDFTQCDCPVDSVVLDKMCEKKLLKDKKSSYVWSKLDEQQYKEIQDALTGASLTIPEGLPICSPRLLYDFDVW